MFCSGSQLSVQKTKKRILLEHEGELKYKPVVKSFRLLGSRFFNEFQTGRTSQRTKVYDANFWILRNLMMQLLHMILEPMKERVLPMLVLMMQNQSWIKSSLMPWWPRTMQMP